MKRAENRRLKKQIQRLEEFYARIPDVACKGLCRDYCGPIKATPLELARMMAELGGAPPPNQHPADCPFLTGEGRCSVYAARPLICRLFAAVEALRCPHGCKPVRYMDEREAQAMKRAIEQLGGKGVLVQNFTK